MSVHKTPYLVASAFAAVAAAVLIASFGMGQYLLAWASALALIICAEIRVQVGGRLPHTTLFWAHLFAAIPLFLGLSVLAFFSQPLWLIAATASVGLLALSSGGLLWHRGTRKALRSGDTVS